MVRAFAKYLEMEPDELTKRIGHDGTATFSDSEVVRSHHIQEIIDICLEEHQPVVPIEFAPLAVFVKEGKRFPIIFGDDMTANFDRFRAHLSTSRGVIQGGLDVDDKQIGHAVYWSGSQCVDHHGVWELWGEHIPFIPSVYWRSV